MARKIVSLNTLGLCKCGTLLAGEDMPSDVMDRPWHCPTCKEIVTTKTLGFSFIELEYKKVKWVGKDGKWTDTRPLQDFILGGWEVRV